MEMNRDGRSAGKKLDYPLRRAAAAALLKKGCVVLAELKMPRTLDD
jgi:hypothetical protein